MFGIVVDSLISENQGSMMSLAIEAFFRFSLVRIGLIVSFRSLIKLIWSCRGT